MRYTAFALLTLIVLTLSFSCKRGGRENEVTVATIITFSSGNASRTGLSGGGQSTNPGSVIHDGDIIINDGKSVVILQIADEAILLINEKAALRFDEISGRQRTLSLLSGSITGKVKKLNKNDGFIINTPSSVLSVRGTDFRISSAAHETYVSVMDGKIAAAASVEKLQTHDVCIINSDKTGRISAGRNGSISVKFSDLTAKDSEKIKVILEIPMILDADSKSGEDLNKSIIPFIRNSSIPPQTAADVKTDIFRKGQASLNQIQNTFGRIDEVTLYNNRTIKGIIQSASDTVTIITPDGKTVIPKSEIKNISSL